MSYITINAELVLNACNAFIDARNKRIEAKREAMIEKTIKNSFFNKTREKAIEQLESEDIFSPWHRLNIRSNSLNTVEELKSLAVIGVKNNSPVNMDANAADILNEYF